MTTLYDDKGNPIENAMTQEEHTAAVEEAMRNNPDAAKAAELQTQLEEAQAIAQKAQEDLEAAGDKGQNIIALRKAKEQSDKDLSDLKGSIMKELGGLRSKIDERDLKQTFNLLADGDAEVASRIEKEYNDITKPEDDEKVRSEKMKKAYQLAVGSSPKPSILGRVLGGSGAPNNNQNKTKWPAELVALGSRMGLTEKDFENKTYVGR